MNFSIKSALVLLFPLCFVSGCVSVKYYGKEYPETKYVRLYFSKSFVPQDKYEIMGEAYITAPQGYTSKDIDEKLISEGKSVGADAILITSIKKVEEAEYTEPTMRGSEPDAPSLSGGVPTTDGGKAISYDDFDNDASGNRRIVYEFETKLRAVFFKEKARDLKAEAVAKSAEGIKVKDIIQTEVDGGSQKVKDLVEQVDKGSGAKAPASGDAAKVKDDSQDQLNKRNEADNLKMNN